MDSQKIQKEEAPKKKVNTRGVLNVSGFNDFNPQMNVQLEKPAGRKSVAGPKEKKEGCCK
jgi:hypothetical protein